MYCAIRWRKEMARLPQRWRQKRRQRRRGDRERAWLIDQLVQSTDVLACEEKGMRWVWIVVGVLALAFGVLWTLQGLNIVSGSMMSGQFVFVIIGPIVALVGLALVVI